MTYLMSASAFKGISCVGGSFVDWLWYVGAFLMYFSMLPGGMPIICGSGWAILIRWFVYPARRWSQVREDVKLHSEGESRLRVFCAWVKCAW